MTVNIRFVSRNTYKLDEARTILAPHDVIVSPFEYPIEELQTVETEALVKDKALKAFRLLGERLFVEHTGLYLDRLNGLPGGLTQIFWDQLKEERFSQLFGSPPENSVTAKTVIGYVDGKQFWFFEGSVRGTIAPSPRGPRGFQWDCVFVPEGYTETFAEMGSKKNDISMRKIALDKLAAHLSGARR